MPLTKEQALDLISATALFARFTSILSDFEVETIAEVGERYRLHGRQAVLTDAEHQVVRDALEAMRKASARQTVMRTAA
jgi:hypothetical protein